MGNPYPIVIRDEAGVTRLGGSVDFTDPANQPGNGGSQPWGGVATAEFSGSGSPIGSVTPDAEGDLYVDTATPALWQATAAGDDTAWQMIGASAPDFPPPNWAVDESGNAAIGADALAGNSVVAIAGTSALGALDLVGNGNAYPMRIWSEGYGSTLLSFYPHGALWLNPDNADQDALKVARTVIDPAADNDLVSTWATNDRAWGVRGGGWEYLGPLAAPADSAVGSERVQWYDDTNNAPALRFKMRDAGNHVVTGKSAGLNADGTAFLGVEKPSIVNATAPDLLAALVTLGLVTDDT